MHIWIENLPVEDHGHIVTLKVIIYWLQVFNHSKLGLSIKNSLLESIASDNLLMASSDLV